MISELRLPQTSVWEKDGAIVLSSSFVQKFVLVCLTVHTLCNKQWWNKKPYSTEIKKIMAKTPQVVHLIITWTSKYAVWQHTELFVSFETLVEPAAWTWPSFTALWLLNGVATCQRHVIANANCLDLVITADKTECCLCSCVCIMDVLLADVSPTHGV